MAEKHDVFVGNLAYNTTEEHLREIFSPVGTVIGVRIVTDRDTGRPRGFAFVEYLDAPTALSAIRNLDGHELNGRKDIARSMGQSVQDSYQSGGRTGEAVIASMKLTEVYDVLEGMKKIIEEDRGKRAHTILEAYPQLVPALIEMQRRLGMVEATTTKPQNTSANEQAPTKPNTNESNTNLKTQQLLLQQLQQVSDEDLKKLPADKRNQLLALREQFNLNRRR